MILNQKLVHEAISKKLPTKKLINKESRLLLDNFFVQDYVVTEKIPVATLDGLKMKLPPVIFYEKYQYQGEIETNEITKRLEEESLQFYDSKLFFPYEFSIHLFETFIAVEILPRTMQTEFLILSPSIKESGNPLFDGTVSSLEMTAISAGLSSGPIAYLAVKAEIDNILEYLRTGLGKKKKFGLF